VPEAILAGVDIGGTKTAVVLSSHPPAILERIVFPTVPDQGPERAITFIIRSLRKLLDSQQFKMTDLQSIGISCGSPLDPIAGVIQEPPNLPTWKDVPIKSIVESAFGVECHLENDANAGALAEHTFGAGSGARDMVFLTMGTGLGAGFILNGQLYRGASYLAGEIGHVRITRSGPKGHNKAGSAEGWASGIGMATVTEKILQAGSARWKSSSLRARDHDRNGSLTARDVWMAAQAGDDLAQHVVRITGEKLGQVIAIILDLLNPERIIVGGLAIRMGEALLGPAREVAHREALQGAFGACQILPAALGEAIGDVAALCVALNTDRDITTGKPQELITS
jgi:glucokinase